MCSSWNDSRSLYTDRSGSRILPNSSELFGIKFLPVLRKIPLQRKMWTRLVFLQWKRYGLFSNPLIAFTFSTEFCHAKINVYSFLFVCLCTRLEFSAHASVFCFCLLLFFYAKLRNALRQRSRPTKKRKITCACSVCHTLHTALYDLPIGILQTAPRQLISLWKHHWWRVVITALLCWSSVNLLCRR